DGLTATAAIRAEEQAAAEQGIHRHVPIVALTAHAMKGDRERCLEAGMDAYVSKPLRAQELFDTIARLLASSSSAKCERPGPTGGQPMQAPAFDLEAALERCDGDRDLLQGMAELFFEQSGKLMPQIAEAVNQRDASALERFAHKLKGSI